jgi:Rrf2 family protein
MIEEISEHEGVPRSFLAKIFQALHKADIVISQRGMGGGFKLARPPAQITLLQIIESVEGRIAFQRCLEDPVGCPKARTCVISKVLARAQNEMKAVFSATTLADLVAGQTTGSSSSPAASPPPETSPSAGDSFSVSIHD